MKQKSGAGKAPAEQVLKDIRRQTRRQYSAEEKISIVLEGLRGEENISELCRRESIAASMYYGYPAKILHLAGGHRACCVARQPALPRFQELLRPSEKAEIIALVEQSHLPARRTLDKLGIPRATFYRWYDRYREGGRDQFSSATDRAPLDG